jgi:hypothetical protein
MSRIVLTKYDGGQDRVVIGYDHPCGGAFWQEFSPEPTEKDAEGWPVYPDDWEEVIRDGGFMPGIPLDKLIESMPADLRSLMTAEVMVLLHAHMDDPDSGYHAQPIDLTA